MKQSQEVIVARIIAASKDIVACEKAMVTLKDIYRTAMRQYFRKHGDPGINCGRLRSYPNRILFQTMMPQVKCSIASALLNKSNF